MNSRRKHFLNLIASNEKGTPGLPSDVPTNRNTNHQESETIDMSLAVSQEATISPAKWGQLSRTGDRLLVGHFRTNVESGDRVWIGQVVDDGDPWNVGRYFLLGRGLGDHPIYTTEPGSTYSYELDGVQLTYRAVTMGRFSHLETHDGVTCSVVSEDHDLHEVPC